MTARYGTRSVSPIDWARRQRGRTMSNGRGIMGEAVDFVIEHGHVCFICRAFDGHGRFAARRRLPKYLRKMQLRLPI